eukprot:TRINITY_DN1999_c0_g1_i2.p1 TRINITY_DN1999_c0_g1~~TRINITY_DN1999_c0_g1_i2.p1  ORF type:complete len:861 (+),score=215.16 TRINITY_DN1999_c0_g1_i2:51-2585(+)
MADAPLTSDAADARPALPPQPPPPPDPPPAPPPPPPDPSPPEAPPPPDQPPSESTAAQLPSRAPPAPPTGPTTPGPPPILSPPPAPEGSAPTADMPQFTLQRAGTGGTDTSRFLPPAPPPPPPGPASTASSPLAQGLGSPRRSRTSVRLLDNAVLDATPVHVPSGEVSSFVNDCDPDKDSDAESRISRMSRIIGEVRGSTDLGRKLKNVVVSLQWHTVATRLIAAKRERDRDIDWVTSDWGNARRERHFTYVLCWLCVWHLVFVLTQFALCTSKHGDGDGKRTPSDGPELGVWYHLLVTVQCVLCIGQAVIVTRLYQLQLSSLAFNDPLWKDTPLLWSPLRDAYLVELLTVMVHEPPALVFWWRFSYKLNVFVFFRGYVFLRYLRTMSFATTMGGRIIASLARVRTGLLFHAKTYNYSNPSVFVGGCSLVAWLCLSVMLYAAEAAEGDNDDELAFSDALWLCFITMTTVGYGDMVPQKPLGRIVSALAAVLGLISTAMIIAGVSATLRLDDRQRKVAIFMQQAEAHKELETLAGAIVAQCGKGMLLRRRIKRNRCTGCPFIPCGSCLDRIGAAKSRMQLKQLCRRFRAVRREFNKMVAEVHHIVPDNVNMGNKLRDMELMMGALFDHMFPQARSLQQQRDDDEAGTQSELSPQRRVRQEDRTLRVNPRFPKRHPLVDLSPSTGGSPASGGPGSLSRRVSEAFPRAAGLRRSSASPAQAASAASNAGTLQRILAGVEALGRTQSALSDRVIALQEETRALQAETRALHDENSQLRREVRETLDLRPPAPGSLSMDENGHTVSCCGVLMQSKELVSETAPDPPPPSVGLLPAPPPAPPEPPQSKSP